MIDKANKAGRRAALARFKLAYLGEGLVNKGIDTARWMALGQAPNVFVEGPRTVAPGGTLHWRNVLWPTMPGRPGMQALGRAGSLLSLAALPGMMHADQHEGTLSKVLGGVGGLAGMMYGGTAGGMLGTPIGMALGRRLGHGVGHLLGSKPKDEYP